MPGDGLPLFHWASTRRRRGLRFVRLRAVLLDSVRTALAKLIDSDNISIILLPHDERGMWSDVVLAKHLEERLGNEYAEEILVLDRLSALDTRSLCRSVDAVISGRMHLV